MSNEQITVTSEKNIIDAYQFATGGTKLTFELKGLDEKKRFLEILKIFQHTFTGILKEIPVGSRIPVKSSLRIENGPVHLSLGWSFSEEVVVFRELVLCAIGELAMEIAAAEKAASGPSFDEDQK